MNAGVSTHTGCVLAIVGSRDCHADAKILIEQVIAYHRPLAVISGGAKARAGDKMRHLLSIDEVAIEVANKLGIPTSEIKPTTWTWLGTGGIKERNLLIANGCTCLTRIGSTTSKTYGSGWTADRAEELGVNVTRYIIDEAGNCSIGNAQPPDLR